MRLTLTTLALLFSTLLFAQAPALIPYQAIARNAAGEPLASSTLIARFTIHDGTATGTNVWQELQTVSTSELGLFSVQLGGSVPLTSVNWDNGTKFMQVELDLGIGFIDLGTQQLLSVPYALQSSEAGNGFAGISNSRDTLFFNSGDFVIIPGISAANGSGNSGNGELQSGQVSHSCGALSVHNPDLSYGTLIDQEGNVYKTITIGTQEWMAENLNTSIYRNGEPIPNVTDEIQWGGLSTGAWCYYNNDSSYSCPHGKLYNWYTCVDGRQLCPTGWHVPSDSQWKTLIGYLDSTLFSNPDAMNPDAVGIISGIAGGKMKSIGSQYWAGANDGATNEVGFSGLPSGYLGSNGIFGGIGQSGSFWSATERYADHAWLYYLVYQAGTSTRSFNGEMVGFSVRCLRD
jgi:uncharacterized protein (TIGR02145 family)